MRSVTPAVLMAELEEMTDTENDPHLGPQEKYRILTRAVASAWNKIILAGRGTEYVRKKAFNTVTNQLEYPISTIISPSTDFFQVSSVYVNEGNGQLRPIDRIHPAEVQAYKAPVQVVPMQLNYIPCAPTWTGSGDVAFDGINGYEELVLCIAAQAIMAKKNDSGSPYAKRQREIEQELNNMAGRIKNPRVVQRRQAKLNDRYLPWRNNVSGWNLVGETLELYYRSGVTY